MRTWMVGCLALALAATTSACDDDDGFFPGGGDPAAPRNLEARYFEGAVHLTWELSPDWNGEFFRVYGKRSTDSGFFVIADVTNCAGGVCGYTDANVVAGESYDYTVTAVDPDTGVESGSTADISVFVPDPIPPPVPGSTYVVALDNANFVTWDAGARAAEDFSFYRVYIDDPASGLFLLGETDSEGFLDLLAENGVTSSYVVSSVDDQGHESDLSAAAEGTPRPDFHGELIYAYQDQPASSGFRFQASEQSDPLVSGDAGNRHFRLEADVAGWRLVPGPGTQIHAQGVRHERSPMRRRSRRGMHVAGRRAAERIYDRSGGCLRPDHVPDERDRRRQSGTLCRGAGRAAGNGPER